MNTQDDRRTPPEEDRIANAAAPRDCEPETGLCLSADAAPKDVVVKQGPGARREIDYYTDPVCSWCWATEPNLKRLVAEYGDQVHVNYKMGRLLESWSVFYDALNDIGRPAQVAPHWADVSRRSGMPIDERLWIEDPPDSTYPASIAVKAAQRQGEVAGERYLRRVREMALTERKNIERREVLLQAAREVGLDPDRFIADLSDPSTEQAFRADLAAARSQGISGFPALVFRSQDGRAVVVRGYQPYATYERVVSHLAGQLAKRQPTNILAFVEKYGHVATQEVATVFGLSREEAERRLTELEDQGNLRRVAVANGHFWELA